jgi:hypothetical protein
MQEVFPRCQQTSFRLDGVTSQSMVLSIVTAMKSSIISLYDIFFSVTNLMELSPSWEVASCVDTRDFPNVWWFTNDLTTALHWSLCWARLIQSGPSHYSYLISILILFAHLWPVLPSGLFNFGFPTNILHASSALFVLHSLLITSSKTWSLYLHLAKSRSY